MMIVGMLLAIALASPVKAEPSLRALTGWYAGGFALDVASTEYGLAKMGSGVAEGNPIPLFRSSAGRIAFAGAASVGMAWGERELRRDGHKRWARALRITFLALRVAAATRNVRLARD
jgi:hypothetical protein